MHHHLTTGTPAGGYTGKDECDLSELDPQAGKIKLILSEANLAGSKKKKFHCQTNSWRCGTMQKNIVNSVFGS